MTNTIIECLTGRYSMGLCHHYVSEQIYKRQLILWWVYLWLFRSLKIHMNNKWNEQCNNILSLPMQSNINSIKQWCIWFFEFNISSHYISNQCTKSTSYLFPCISNCNSYSSTSDPLISTLHNKYIKIYSQSFLSKCTWDN